MGAFRRKIAVRAIDDGKETTSKAQRSTRHREAVGDGVPDRDGRAGHSVLPIVLGRGTVRLSERNTDRDGILRMPCEGIWVVYRPARAASHHLRASASVKGGSKYLQRERNAVLH